MTRVMIERQLLNDWLGHWGRYGQDLYTDANLVARTLDALNAEGGVVRWREASVPDREDTYLVYIRSEKFTGFDTAYWHDEIGWIGRGDVDLSGDPDVPDVTLFWTDLPPKPDEDRVRAEDQETFDRLKREGK